MMSSGVLSFLSLLLIGLSLFVFWFNDRTLVLSFKKPANLVKPAALVTPKGCSELHLTYLLNHLKGGICPLVCLAVLEKKSLYYVFDRWYAVNGRYAHGARWTLFLKYLSKEGFEFTYHLLTGEDAFRVRPGFVNVVGLVWSHRAHFIVVSKDWFFSNDRWIHNSHLSTFLLGARRCGYVEVRCGV